MTESEPNIERHYGLSDAELVTHPTAFAPDLFKARVVAISGGGSGVGKAIAILMARLGADLILCGRRPEKLETTALLLKGLGARVNTMVANVRAPEQVDAFIERAWSQYGRLDVLVNNAGGQFAQPAIDFRVKGWNAVIDTNLNGTWSMMQAAARRWRDSGAPGNIVNITATIGRGLPHMAHSTAARAGVIYLSKTVAVGMGPAEYPGELSWRRGGRKQRLRTVQRGGAQDVLRKQSDAAPWGRLGCRRGLCLSHRPRGQVHQGRGSHDRWRSVDVGRFLVGRPDYFRIV